MSELEDLTLDVERIRGVLFTSWADAPEEGLGEDARRTAAIARETAKSFQHKAREVRSDERFTEEGHRERLAELREDPNFRLSDLEGRTKRRLEGLRQRQKQFKPFEEPDASNARAVALEGEVRRRFNALDSAAERRRFIQQARERGDELTLRAVLGADVPGSLVEISDQMRDLHRNEILEEKHGEDVTSITRDIEVLERALSELERAGRVMDLEVRDEVAPEETPAARTARRNRERMEAREAEAEAKREAAAAS